MNGCLSLSALRSAGNLYRVYPASRCLTAGIGLQQIPLTHVWMKQVQTMMMTMTATAAAVTAAIYDCFVIQTYWCKFFTLFKKFFPHFLSHDVWWWWWWGRVKTFWAPLWIWSFCILEQRCRKMPKKHFLVIMHLSQCVCSLMIVAIFCS